MSDDALVWSMACNCLLYETDPGPVNINIGTEIEPKIVDRQHAWREMYARLLVERVDADISRLDAMVREYRGKLDSSRHPEHWQGIHRKRLVSDPAHADEILTPRGQQEIREVYECGLALCDMGARMVRESGAADDEQARQRLLAGLKHQNTVDVLGFIPGVAEDSADDLTRRLNDLDP